MSLSSKKDEFAVDLETFNRKYNALVAKMKSIVDEKIQIENDMERYINTLQKINIAARETSNRRESRRKGSITIDARLLLKPEPVLPVSTSPVGVPVCDPPRPQTNYVNEYEEFKKWRAERYRKPDPVYDLRTRPVGVELQHASTSTSSTTTTTSATVGFPQQDASKRVLGRMFVYNFKTKALKQNVFDPWPDDSVNSIEKRVTLDLTPYEMAKARNVTHYPDFLEEIARLESNLDFLQRRCDRLNQ